MTTTETKSPGDALFTKTQQKVLALLFGNTKESFYLNEIVRLAGFSGTALSWLSVGVAF